MLAWPLVKMTSSVLRAKWFGLLHHRLAIFEKTSTTNFNLFRMNVCHATRISFVPGFFFHRTNFSRDDCFYCFFGHVYHRTDINRSRFIMLYYPYRKPNTTPIPICLESPSYLSSSTRNHVATSRTWIRTCTSMLFSSSNGSVIAVCKSGTF